MTRNQAKSCERTQQTIFTVYFTLYLSTMLISMWVNYKQGCLLDNIFFRNGHAGGGVVGGGGGGGGGGDTTLTLH